MADGPGFFAMVLLEEAMPPVANEIYGVLSKTIGRVRYDVMAAFKRSPGIPFEDLSEPQAVAAVKLFTAAGIPAAAVQSVDLPAPARTFLVHRVGVGDEGFSVQTELVGTMRVLPWDGIAAVSAATLTESSGPAHTPKGPSIGSQLAGAAARMAVGLPKILPTRAPQQSAAAPRAAAHQVLAVSPLDADFELRFRASELGYEFLGERMTSSAAHNFRLFAAALLPRCDRARISRAVRALAAEGTAPPPMEADAFSLHNRWLRVLAAQGL
jgi:hypothetical protein